MHVINPRALLCWGKLVRRICFTNSLSHGSQFWSRMRVAPEMTISVCQNVALKRNLAICFGKKRKIKTRRPLPTNVEVTVQNPCVGIGIEWGFESEEEWVPVRKIR